MSCLKRFLGRRPHPPRERTKPILTIQLPAETEPQNLYGDQILRKQWAEGVLQQQGIRINPHLPVIESEAEVEPRTAQEIAERLIALSVVAAKGSGIEQEFLDKFVVERNAASFLTPAEVEFMADANPSDHDRVQFSWRYESAWVMYWALRNIETPLSFPSDCCDVDLLVSHIHEVEDLAAKGRHVTNNLLNEADLIYRYHWVVRQSSIDGTGPPGGLHPRVVMERHQALNWLIGYGDRADWDDVSTDT